MFTYSGNVVSEPLIILNFLRRPLKHDPSSIFIDQVILVLTITVYTHHGLNTRYFVIRIVDCMQNLVMPVVHK